VFLGATPSKASWILNACKVGLKVKLPSGVVGAVESSRMVSSKTAVDAACRSMVECRLRRQAIAGRSSSPSFESALQLAPLVYIQIGSLDLPGGADEER
jgi:hypothetical protein